MKRIFVALILLFLVFTCASCDLNFEDEKFKLIVPTGTPSIALSYFIDNSDDVEAEIVSGSDPLVAAFTSKSFDIIVAPVNLGAKFYNQIEDFEYVLYRPIVGCGFYIMSTNEIVSFTELDNKDLYAFNEMSTPGVMVKALSKYYNVNPNVTYLTSVIEANSYLLASRADYILSAEPSKTIISTKGNFYSLDISEAWKEMVGDDYDVPQAGIFVKKSLLKQTSFKNILKEINNSVSIDALSMAKAAIKVDPNFASMNEELLARAIPNCHFITTPLNKDAVVYYFECLSDLGLINSIGGRLPDEEFYYKEN